MSKIWHLWADHDAVLARCDAISTNHDANDDFDEEALKNPEVYFENGDGIHFKNKSIQPLIDIV